MRPVHPGEILRDELQTIGLSANALSTVNSPIIWEPNPLLLSILSGLQPRASGGG